MIRSSSAPSPEKLQGQSASGLGQFCGLPNHAFNPSALALVYKCRKPICDDEGKVKYDEEVHRHKHNKTAESNPGTSTLVSSLTDGLAGTQKGGVSENSVLAQRKVAQALLTMAKNDAMAYYFIFQGGIEAAMKLIGDSKDNIVLKKCAGTLTRHHPVVSLKTRASKAYPLLSPICFSHLFFRMSRGYVSDRSICPTSHREACSLQHKYSY